MSEAKPACSKFIIVAIRQLRMKTANLKTNTAAGFSLVKLFEVARELYPAEEIKRTIETLIKSGEIIFIARVTLCALESQGGKTEFGTSRKQRLQELPEDVNLIKLNQWHVDENFNPIDRSKPGTHRWFSGLKLYVAEDGLPGMARAAEKFDRRVMTLADKIVQSM